MRKIIDETGNTYGRLTVLSIVNRKYHWNCLCSCGKETIVLGEHLRTSNTRSCGCLKKEVVSKRNTRHGMYHAPGYRTWQNMLQRCNNPKNSEYKNYLGRGIKVCSEWHDFAKFFADMGPLPQGMSLDRIDNNGDYCKVNCRWATTKEQSRNKRSNRILELNGEKLHAVDWAKKLGIDYSTLHKRLEKWPIERALTEIKNSSHKHI